ncbi:uncharacterized protein V1513DRAFT_427911 [Lipomyces chichibuensis]|uniref:uncharacterized protein n=1 Tax=Lipomyces chichibuensis TaxID=1546026 RepID=UPI0033431D7E
MALELLREALARADGETDSARREAEEARKDANQALQTREGTLSTGGLAAVEGGHQTKPRVMSSVRNVMAIVRTFPH